MREVSSRRVGEDIVIRVGWVVAGVVVVAGALGGCADPASGSSAPTVPATASEAQRAQWALPLDPYIFSQSEMTNYAENLLVSDCMSEKNLDWPIPAIDVDHLSVSWESPGGRRILTVEVAQQYGYHTPSPLPRDVVKQMGEMNARQLSPTEQSALDACIQAARQTLPLPEINQIGNQYANADLVAAAQQPAVVAAAAAWRQCMAPLGISDLPQMPEGGSSSMPTASQSAAFGLDVVESDPDSQPSTQEIAAAVADAQCRDSSGFSGALYDAEWSAQSVTLAQHADELVREKDAIDAYVDAARRVIAERTGS